MTLPYPTMKPLADALERRGYEVLTPVQIEMMRPDLIEADLLVSAQTGSGKTVGFGLAIAPTLLGASDILPPAAAPLALIIAPTRELALQVKREFQWLYQDAGVTMASCVGGMDMRDERRALDRGAHIVVATPGRLRDHIMRGSIDLSQIRAVVLDEADEMLDLGFKDDLEFILSEAPDTRRTLMFSATVPRGIAELSKTYLKDNAVRVATTTGATQHADIEYRALTAAYDGTEGAIINLLRYYEAQNAIVFCNTRATVSRLVARFANRGFSVVALSGELSQAERTHALQAMRDGRARVCVATDVAARGIDLPNLELVIHAELPTNSETLMHRSGRTGRAGRKGVSALVVTPKTRAKAERLLKFAKITAEWALPPSADEVRAKDEERLINDPVWSEPLNEGEEDFVARLTATYSAQQIAGAYLRLFYSRHSAPEELPDPDLRPERSKREAAPRKTFGPSSWLKLSVGANERAEARWLLPTLCKAGDITRDDIGAIRVQADETYVELLSSALPGFLKALGPDAALDGGAKVVVLDAAPDLGAMPRLAPPPREERGERKPHRGAERPERAERAAPVRRAPPPAEAAAWADVPDRMPPAGAAPVAAPVADTPAAPRPAKPAGTRPGPKAEGFKSSGFKSHGGAPRDGAKPARTEGMKSHAAKPRSDKPREMDPAVHRGFDAPKPRADKPYGKPGDKPYGKPAGKPGAKPYGKPAGKPGDKPYGKPAGKPGDKPYGKPAGKPGAKPFGKPGGKPWDKAPGEAPAAPARNAAANTSARLGPGGKPLPAGKGGKPRTGGPARGPNAVPRRKP
jgi:ATP-dependent RNA helicase DeaD